MFPLSPVFKKANAFSRLQFQQENCFKCGATNSELGFPPTCNPLESTATSFCLDTSLHGLKYVGKKKLHTLERIFWLAAFLGSAISGAWFIWGMWTDYVNRPIVTILSSEELALDAIPFPAVTICNVNIVRKSTFKLQLMSALENILKYESGLISKSELFESIVRLKRTTQICESTSTFQGFSSNLTELQKINEVANKLWSEMDYAESKVEFEAADVCKDMILRCVWQKLETKCNQLFRPVTTDYGTCCVFNSMPVSLQRKYGKKNTEPKILEEWIALNLGYDNLIFTDKTRHRKYPERQRYPGRSAGLSILIEPDLDDYLCALTDSQGFMLGLNVPIDIPNVKDNSIAIATNSEVFVGIRPEIIIPDESIKSYPIKTRRCYYDREHELRFHKVYTAVNCMDECIAAATFRECQCVNYDMPRGDNQSYCPPEKYKCTAEVHWRIFQLGLKNMCRECLPTCTEIEYPVQTSSLRLRSEQATSLAQQFPEIGNSRGVSIVHIYLSTDSTYAKLRNEDKSILDLLSGAGGILGLCLGFSMLSLLEIVYAGTIRLCCNLHHAKIIGQKNTEQNEKEGNLKINQRNLKKAHDVFMTRFETVDELNKKDELKRFRKISEEMERLHYDDILFPWLV